MIPHAVPRMGSVPVLSMLLVMAAFATSAPGENRAPWVALGDSITEGFTYPLWVLQSLSEEGRLAPSWVNAGVAGDTAGKMQPGLNFSSIEQLGPKVGKSCPHFLYKFGKCFSANPRIGVGIAKYAVFRESGDKRVSVATVPSIVITSGNLGSFHYFGPQSEDFDLFFQGQAIQLVLPGLLENGSAKTTCT